MAHTKAAGATRLGRDSQGQRLGTKVSDGQQVHSGSVLVRQRGTLFASGPGVKRGKDDTLYAAITGIVRYRKRKRLAFTGQTRRKTIVAVELQNT